MSTVNYLGLRHTNHGFKAQAYESWVNFDCIFLFLVFGLVSGNLGRWVWAHTLRVYTVFRKTGQGPWLRGDSSLGPKV